MRCVAIAATVIVALLAMVAPASARRAPTTGESAGIRAAVARYAARPKSQASADARVVRAFVSTVDRRYALAKLISDGASSTAILKRRAHHWKVIRFGTGGFVRFGLPKRVVEDLLGGHLCGCGP